MSAWTIRPASALWLMLLALPATTSAQTPVVIDQILSRPYGEILTQSDVWQALTLGLLPASVSTPGDALRAIENRRLMLREVNRLPPPEPVDAEIAARRAAWESRTGASNVPALLAKVGMSDTALQTWFRNEIRIQTYLAQRFSATSEADRPAAVEAWVSLLRDRAGLR
jgi:hypothetical protein